MSTNVQPAPAPKICCRCGKDVSQIKRSKDQFGNYYCADCLKQVNIVKHEPGEAHEPLIPPSPPGGEGRVRGTAEAPPLHPASEPIATVAAKDDLALQATAGESPHNAAAAEARGTGLFVARVVFRPAKDIQWPRRCVGCFARNPKQTLKLGVAPSTEFGSLAKMGKLGGMLRGLTMRLASAGRHETGHYNLPVCDNCCVKLSTSDVAALAGQNDSVEPPPYRVQTALLTREIDRRCVVLSFCSQEYADAFRQANAAAVFDNVDACAASSREKAQLAAQAAAEARPEPAGAGSSGGTKVSASGTPQAAGAEPAQPAEPAAARPQTQILERPPARPPTMPSAATGEGRGEGAPALGPGDATPPALPAVGFLDTVRSLEAQARDSRADQEPPPGDALPPPVVAQASSPAPSLVVVQASSLPASPGGTTGAILVPVAAQASSLPATPVVVQASSLPATPVVVQASRLPATPVVVRASSLPPASSSAPLEEQVLELLQGQAQTAGLHVTPEITPERLAAATRACQVPDSECVLALVDCTASGAADNALVFGCNGIYYHNGAGSRSAGSGAISYHEFPRRAFEDGGANEVALGFGQFLNLAECPAPPGKVIEVLQAVKELAGRRIQRPAAPPPPPRLPEAVLFLDDLRQLAKTHLPDGPVKVLGAATWEAEGGLGAKLGTLLSGKNAQAAQKEYRAGLIAVMADKLVVADLGTAANGEITLAGLKEMGPAKLRSCRLRAVRAQFSESVLASTLELHGDIELKALFPVSCGQDNPAKAGEIATAIRCA